MICYLIRHGKDDETVRGGWSQHLLTDEGIHQSEVLAEEMVELTISSIFSSDLTRAMQTAQILADKLQMPVIPLAQFREVNNGVLAGMKNDLALEMYPDLFWNQLDWEQCYPDGESPKDFYERICKSWSAFADEMISRNEDVVLVTHAGVIHVILSILENRTYSNCGKHRKVNHAEVIMLSYHNGVWSVCK